MDDDRKLFPVDLLKDTTKESIYEHSQAPMDEDIVEHLKPYMDQDKDAIKLLPEDLPNDISKEAIFKHSQPPMNEIKDDIKLFVEYPIQDTTNEITPEHEQQLPVDENDRKLFVGGIRCNATKKDISEHFKSFGEIQDINLKVDLDPVSREFRGFAFVLYKTIESLNAAIEAKKHTVKGKHVAVKKAHAKPGKVFVGNLTQQPQLTRKEIKEHFSQYGVVTSVVQPFDKKKKEQKSFCFITFDNENAAKKLLKLGITTLKGVKLNIKRVTTTAPAVNSQFIGPYGGYRQLPNPYGGYSYSYPYGVGWRGYCGFGGYIGPTFF